MNNPFWEYSLEVYSVAGVATHCLALQDEFDADVNVVLYGAWLGSSNLQLTSPHLDSLERRIGPWRDTVVRPLRSLRRKLRGEPEAYREMKALELTAERQQQDEMYRHFAESALTPAVDPLMENLVLIVTSHDSDTGRWNQRLEDLSQLLSGAPGGGGAGA